ncbi:hypothetical protein RB595_001527 [Gaeumannomyces hyphopodioides]
MSEYSPDCYLCRIDLWLRGCAAADIGHATATEAVAPVHPQKRRATTMPTPPSSSNRREMSPSKRQRADADDDNDNEIDQTPRANQPTSDQQRTVVMLPPPNQPTFPAGHIHGQSRGLRTRSTGSGLSPVRKRRVPSPVKRTGDLQALFKPIEMKQLLDPESQLPPDMFDLYTLINDIVVCQNEFIPAEAREAVTEVLQKSKTVRKSCPDDWFFPNKTTAANSEDSRAAAKAELAELLKIKGATMECSTENVSEAAWNLDVHAPMLELATQGSRVKRLLVTTARIAPTWLPIYIPASASVSSASSPAAPSTGRSYTVTEDGDGAVATGKLVDFALVLSESSMTPLGSAISKQNAGALLDEKSINQSTYTPLTFRPLGVSIETKARQGSVDEGHVQLGLWTAAWFARVQKMVSDKPTEGMPTAVPVILVHETFWRLSFVCDRGSTFDFVGNMVIGDTETLLGLYKLLAALRVLIQWMDTKLRVFFEDLIGVCTSPRD